MYASAGRGMGWGLHNHYPLQFFTGILQVFASICSHLETFATIYEWCTANSELHIGANLGQPCVLKFESRTTLCFESRTTLCTEF